MNGCKHCEYVGGPGLPPHDPTFPCPGCGRGGPVMLFNASDPEQSDVRFYPVTTAYSEGAQLAGMSGLPPKRFYENVLSTYRALGAPMPSDQYTSAVIEGTWYSYFQPEYKAYPAIIAALAATKIEIGCEHLRLPFPAFVIRLPGGFLQEEGGPPIRCLFVAMMKSYGDRFAKPVTSIESEPAPGSLTVPFGMGFRGSPAKYVIMIQAKYIDRDGDDAFANFMFALERDKTIEEQFATWLEHSKTLDSRTRERIRETGGYFMGDRLARELLALAVGVSFFATGRHKSQSQILQREKRPRHERRRFEKENDGNEQPTFMVGRELILPRESGAPSTDGDASVGEGAGRSLKWAHYRTGHMRYQAHGPGHSERKLIFVEPTLVRPDLPMGSRVTPGQIIARPARDVTEDRS